jgi:hypothetical protein
MVTMDLRQRPGLEKQTNDLLAPADAMLVTSESESFAASLYLERIQKLRRWVKSIYSDAKQPLAVAKRTLDAQVRALVLAVAGQILCDMPGSTKVTKRWLTTVCRPSPQASLGLLTASAPALNALARALKHDLSVPGTTLSETTTLVAK